MNSDVVQKENAAPARTSPEKEVWLTPYVDVHENKDAYVIQAEMPGVNKHGLEINVDGNELTIIGRRHEPPIQAEALHREIRPVNFRRAFELDPAIDTKKISARVVQGVLTLSLPKTEKTKPQRISVEG